MILIPTIFTMALLYAAYIESDLLLIVVGIFVIVLACKDILKEM